jgi:hypothetical protein
MTWYKDQEIRRCGESLREQGFFAIVGASSKDDMLVLAERRENMRKLFSLLWQRRG